MPPKCEASHLDVYAGTFCFMLNIHTLTVVFAFGLSSRSSRSLGSTEQYSISLSLTSRTFEGGHPSLSIRYDTAHGTSLIRRQSDHQASASY
jgi:hypothetical protein